MVDDVGGDRKRERVGGFASLVEAERACADFLGVGSRKAQAKAWTVSRWLEFWLAGSAERLRPNTLRSYRSHVRTYLVPALGGYRLSKLTTLQVQRAMDGISRRTTVSGRLIAASTVQRVRATLRSAFNAAVGAGMMGRNPALWLRLGKGARPLAVLWTEDREKEFAYSGLKPAVVVGDPPCHAVFDRAAG
jgi:hypothetical protein